MTSTPGRIRRPKLVAAAFAALAFAVVAAPAAEAASKPPKGQVRVMTRNLYLGADLGPALAATNATQLALAAGAIQQVVDQTDFPRRSKLLAKEIKKANPDLVGLQEVARWRNDCDIVNPPFCPVATPPAQDGPLTPARSNRYNFLDLLMTKLNKGKTGPDFRIVRVQKEADIEVPLSTGGDGRLTMRDVILARKDEKVVTKDADSKRFENNLTQVVAGILPVTFWRGWLSAEATVRGEEFRFINTHLESFDPDIREDQAGELIAGLPEIGPANAVQSAGTPVVLAGDLNTDDDLVEQGEGSAADEEPYAVLTTDPDIDQPNPGDNGPRIPFEERSFDGPGPLDTVFSCCYHNQTIDDPADTFDHTVDHVMVSDDDPGADPNSNDITLVNSFVTGENVGGAGDTTDMTAPPRLWPSDHGGVVSTLLFP